MNEQIRVSLLALVATVVVSGSGFAMAQVASADIGEQSLTGTVTSTGRLTHQYSCKRNQTLQSCTLDSVGQGSPFVLLVGDRPYVLEVTRPMIARYAGGRATVTGLVSDDDHIHVHTVSSPKRERHNSENGLASLR